MPLPLARSTTLERQDRPGGGGGDGKAGGEAGSTFPRNPTAVAAAGLGKLLVGSLSNLFRVDSLTLNAPGSGVPGGDGRGVPGGGAGSGRNFGGHAAAQGRLERGRSAVDEDKGGAVGGEGSLRRGGGRGGEGGGWEGREGGLGGGGLAKNPEAALQVGLG
jgi:hypothetical protein